MIANPSKTDPMAKSRDVVLDNLSVPPAFLSAGKIEYFSKVSGYGRFIRTALFLYGHSSHKYIMMPYLTSGVHPFNFTDIPLES
jgi:hypothetical protein